MYQTRGRSPCCEKRTPAAIPLPYSKPSPLPGAGTEADPQGGCCLVPPEHGALPQGAPTRPRVGFIALLEQNSTQPVTPHSAFPLPLSQTGKMSSSRLKTCFRSNNSTDPCSERASQYRQDCGPGSFSHKLPLPSGMETTHQVLGGVFFLNLQLPKELHPNFWKHPSL